MWTAPSWQELSSHMQQHWSVRPCVRPFSAAHVAAGHNALRGSGPDHVRFGCKTSCPLSANSGHRSPLLNHIVGAADREAVRAVAIGPDRAYINCSTSKQREPTAPSSGNRLGVSGRTHPMFTAKHFRAKAAESAEALKDTDVPSEIRKFQRSEASFNALAENEDWLANNFDKIVHSQDTPLQEGRWKTCRGCDCRRNRGAYSSLPRRGRHPAMEHHSNEASARTLRYRRLNGGRAEISRAERTDCPLPA